MELAEIGLEGGNAQRTAEAKATHLANIKQVNDVFVPWLLQALAELIDSMQISLKSKVH